MLVNTYLRFIFSLSCLLSVEDKSSLSKNFGEMQTAMSLSIILRTLESSGSRRRGDTNKSFHPFAPVEVTLAFSDQGPENSKTILSPLTLDLHSRHGRVKDHPYTASAAIPASPQTTKI